MGEQGQTASKSKTLPMILAVIGILLAIVGIVIITVPGTHLRGSGLGTISLVAGAALLVVGLWRFTAKSN